MVTMLDIDAFATQHGLDEEAVKLLETCTEDVLVSVFDSFHSENSNNPSARLSSFVKKMSGSHNSERFSRLLTRLEAFVLRWNLDEAAQENLASTTPDVQDHVINNFSPDAATKNVNAACMSFVKLAKIKVEEESTGRQATARRSSFALGAAVPHRARMPSYSDGDTGDTIDTAAVARFIRKHALDANASAILIEMPGSIRDSVLTSFSPPADADTSKLFTSFATSRWKGSKKVALTERENGRRESPRKRRRDFQDFIDQFGLDDLSVSALENLPKDVARIVMADFRPPANTENVNKLFLSFARSQGRINDRPPVYETRSRGSTAVWANGQGLDDKAKDLLFSLNPDTQAAVMRAFQPEVGGNVNKIFMSFVHNMSKRR